MYANVVRNAPQIIGKKSGFWYFPSDLEETSKLARRGCTMELMRYSMFKREVQFILLRRKLGILFPSSDFWCNFWVYKWVSIYDSLMRNMWRWMWVENNQYLLIWLDWGMPAFQQRELIISFLVCDLYCLMMNHSNTIACKSSQAANMPDELANWSTGWLTRSWFHLYSLQSEVDVSN